MIFIQIKKILRKILSYHSIHIFIELFIAALFLACSIEVIKHHDKFIIPHFENLALIAAANLSAHGEGKDCLKDCTVIVEISDSRFREFYHESSPIDRCQFSKDLLTTTLALKPKTLFIDYDLSPISEEVSFETRKLREGEHIQSCQTKLDTLLDSIGSTANLILLEPLPDTTSIKNVGWKKDRKLKNIRFTDGIINSPSGLTTTYSINENSVASVICHSMGCANQNHIHRVSNAKEDEDENDSNFINFKAFANSVKILAIEDIATNHTYITNKIVMLGGRYGKDDKFTTPIGDLYGVDIHAASYISQNESVTALHKLIVLIIDVAIGMLVGFIVKHSWEYFLKNHSGLIKHKILPLFMLIVMFIFMILCVLISLKISILIMDHWSVWLNPAPIVIGMVIHAFVMAPVEIIQEHSQYEENPHILKPFTDLKNTNQETENWLKPLTMTVPIFGLIAYGLFLYIYH